MVQSIVVLCTVWYWVYWVGCEGCYTYVCRRKRQAAPGSGGLWGLIFLFIITTAFSYRTLLFPHFSLLSAVLLSLHLWTMYMLPIAFSVYNHNPHSLIAHLLSFTCVPYTYCPVSCGRPSLGYVYSSNGGTSSSAGFSSLYIFVTFCSFPAPMKPAT